MDDDPVEIRYAWPSELDLMAELAGLRLRHRWSDWSRAPFTAASYPAMPVPTTSQGTQGREQCWPVCSVSGWHSGSGPVWQP
jgi:hypothetical protein